MAEFVDLDSMPRVNKLKVTVDGKKTPLSIGDKIRYSEEDPTAKTVISITIFEDKRIVYTLEWADDDGELKQENVTLTELKVLAENMSRRLKV
jgi:hypothetical protein